MCSNGQGTSWNALPQACINFRILQRCHGAQRVRSIAGHALVRVLIVGA
jgi:hypothetical protein